jgi:hypothetical protein
MEIDRFHFACWHFNYAGNFAQVVQCATKPNFKKLVKLLLTQTDRNHEAIELLNVWWPAESARLKAAWHDASITCQNDYRNPDPRYIPGAYKMSAEEKRKQSAAIKRNNAALMSKVKSAKRAYERHEDRRSIYIELYNQRF